MLKQTPEPGLIKRCDACEELKTREDFNKSASGQRVQCCKVCVGVGKETQCSFCKVWTLRSKLTERKISKYVIYFLCDACTERYSAWCSRKKGRR